MPPSGVAPLTVVRDAAGSALSLRDGATRDVLHDLPPGAVVLSLRDDANREDVLVFVWGETSLSLRDDGVLMHVGDIAGGYQGKGDAEPRGPARWLSLRDGGIVKSMALLRGGAFADHINISGLTMPEAVIDNMHCFSAVFYAQLAVGEISFEATVKAVNRYNNSFERLPICQHLLMLLAAPACTAIAVQSKREGGRIRRTLTYAAPLRFDTLHWPRLVCVNRPISVEHAVLVGAEISSRLGPFRWSLEQLRALAPSQYECVAGGPLYPLVHAFLPVAVARKVTGMLLEDVEWVHSQLTGQPRRAPFVFKLIEACRVLGACSLFTAHVGAGDDGDCGDSNPQVGVQARIQTTLGRGSSLLEVGDAGRFSHAAAGVVPVAAAVIAGLADPSEPSRRTCSGGSVRSAPRSNAQSTPPALVPPMAPDASVCAGAVDVARSTGAQMGAHGATTDMNEESRAADVPHGAADASHAKRRLGPELPDWVAARMWRRNVVAAPAAPSVEDAYGTSLALAALLARPSRTAQPVERSFSKINDAGVDIVEGLERHQGVLDAEQQRALLKWVDCVREDPGQIGAVYHESTVPGKHRNEAGASAKRRQGRGRHVYQSGDHTYSFKRNSDGTYGSLNFKAKVGPIAPPIRALIDRLRAEGIITIDPDAVIMTVYEPGEGGGELGDNIGLHEDFRGYKRPICSLSLGSEQVMVFQQGGCSEAVSMPVGSLLVMGGVSGGPTKHSTGV